MAPPDLAAIIPRNLLLSYLGALFIVGVAAMAADKTSAIVGFDRISERDLSLIAFAGGFTGIIVGGVTIRHKVSKPEFWVPVAVATIVWMAILVSYFFPSVLKF